MLTSQRHHSKRWKFMISPESACFRTEACPWETFKLCFKLVKWFPLQNQPLGIYLKIRTTRSTIFMLNICIYNNPFKVFMNRKYEGVEDLVCGKVGETKWFKRFLMLVWIRRGVHEITSMLTDAKRKIKRKNVKLESKLIQQPFPQQRRKKACWYI